MVRRHSTWCMAALFGVLMMGAGTGAAEVVDKVVVVVNDEVITLSEVDQRLGPLYQEYQNIYRGADLAKKVEEARQKVIDELIDQKLLLGAAKKEAIEVKDKEVEERLEELRKKFGSREDLERALIRENTTVGEIRKRLKEQIAVKKFINNRIISKITVSPVEVRDYYEAHRHEFGEPEKVKMRDILIKIKDGGGSNENPAVLAAEVARRLREGGDFAGLAKAYSEGPGADEGGSMGYVKKGDLKKEIEDVVFALKPGECSNVIRTDLGCYIFKVEEKVPARVRELSEVRVDIENFLFNNKAGRSLREVAKDLRKNAYIEFK